MRRLYHQFYLTIIASLIAVVLAAGALWRFAPNDTPAEQALEIAGELVSPHLAPLDAGLPAQQQAIDRLHTRLGIDLALFDKERRPLAAAGGSVPYPPGRREGGGWVYGRGGAAWAIRLPDGRWVVAGAPARHRRPVAGVLAFLGVIALVVAICAYPLVRRLTRRLERLQAGVEFTRGRKAVRARRGRRHRRGREAGRKLQPLCCPHRGADIDAQDAAGQCLT